MQYRVQRHCRAFLPIFLVLVFLPRSAAAQELPVIDIGDLEHRLLQAPAEFLVTDAPLDLAGLREAGRLPDFRLLRRRDLNQGISDRSFWLRARLRNSSSRDLRWVLHQETTWIDHMTVFLADAGTSMQMLELSDRQPFNSRPLRYRKLGLRHTTPAGAYTDVYLRLENQAAAADSISLNIHLWEERHFQRRQAGENLLFGLYFGSVLSLMVVALVLGLSVRRASFLYYTLFLAATSLFWLQLSGFAFQYLWPGWVWGHNEGFHLIYLLVSLLAIQFSRELLSTRLLLPRVDRLLRLMLLIGALGLPLRLAGFYAPVLYLAAAYIAFLCLLPLLGWQAWRRGVRHASWYCAAWLIYGATLLAGLISAYTPWLHWGMGPLLFTQVGSVLENLLLLFATAMRVVSLERERRQALAMANSDPLTGLGNRRLLSRHYELMKGEARINGQSVYLLLLDIDRFKGINDRYGHEAGDRVLVETGELLRDHCRGSDVSARLGGEEFAVLLVADSLDDARQAAERIRTQFALSPTRHQGQMINHTLSIGLTPVFDGELALSEKDMLQRADEALYLAKADGRNRAIVFDERMRADVPGL